jgi:hypothetical protein
LVLISNAYSYQMTDALKNLLTAMWDQASAEDREPYEKKEQEDQARCVSFCMCRCRVSVGIAFFLAVVSAVTKAPRAFPRLLSARGFFFYVSHVLTLPCRYERELLAYNAAKAAFVASQGSGAASGSVKKKKPKVEKAAA